MYKENAPKFLNQTKPFGAFSLPVMLVVGAAGGGSTATRYANTKDHLR